MCGIVGYIGRQDAAPILIEGLHRLEYRGYDSAGIAVVRAAALRLFKSRGKIRDLERILPESPKGSPGIAHTRWATHGEPSDRNAHPHTDTTNRFAIVHNGIIENSAELRAQLTTKGVEFRSDTDSEVLAHLIAAMGGKSLERRRAGGAAPGHGHLRSDGARCGASRGAGRRPAGQPGDNRHRRTRNAGRFGCRRAGAPHAQHRASRRW